MPATVDHRASPVGGLANVQQQPPESRADAAHSGDPYIHFPFLRPGYVKQHFVVRNLHLQHSCQFRGQRLLNVTPAVGIPIEGIQAVEEAARHPAYLQDSLVRPSQLQVFCQNTRTRWHAFLSEEREQRRVIQSYQLRNANRRRHIEQALAAELARVLEMEIADYEVLFDIPRPEKWEMDVWVTTIRRCPSTLGWIRREPCNLATSTPP